MVLIKEALEIIGNMVHGVGSEIIPIENGVGRVLFKDYFVSYDLPRFDNSAMDGYAVKVSDRNRVVQVGDVVYAGSSVDGIKVKDGYSVKIMTGSAIPLGCEAVVPVEDVTLLGNGKVKLPDNIKLNSMIRFKGEDVKKGNLLLPRYKHLNGYSLALLSSQGITHIEVFRKVRVIVLSNGNELKAHYEDIELNKLYNSNSLMLYGRLKELGCDVSYLNIASDSLDSLKSLINSSLDANLILTSGGISVGDKDYTLQAFQDIGMEIFFSKIDIKPGKPTTFGKLGNSFVVNLPGNPLASAVNFEMFVKPIVYKLQGLDVSSRVLKVKLKHNINLKRNKDTIILGVFDGEYFIPIKHQKPGMISPLGSFNSILQTSHNLKENDIVNIFAL